MVEIKGPLRLPDAGSGLYGNAENDGIAVGQASVDTSGEAVKGINIDKVTVWDTGNGSEGKTATSNFISGLMKSVPPLEDLFKLAGMELPSYLKGKGSDRKDGAEEIKGEEV